MDGLGMSRLEKLKKKQDGCPDTHFQCPRGFCIPSYLLNNRVLDCPGGHDENIPILTCPGFYRCHGTGSCLHPDNLCDKIYQCPLHDDELYCGDEGCPDNCSCEGQAFRCQAEFDFSAHLYLRYLDLSGSYDTNLDGIENLEYLQLLNLSSCGLKQVRLRFLTNLRILDLSFNRIRRFADLVFSSLPELLHLNLSFNPMEHVLDLGSAAEMIKLKTLTMIGTGLELIGPGSLANLPQLSILDIRMNRVEVLVTNVFGPSLRVLYTDNPKLCCHHFHSTQLGECHAPVNELSSCSDLLRYDFLRALLWIMAFMALTGNVVVLVYRACIEQQGTSLAYKVLVINLSTADFLMGVYIAVIGGADVHFRGIYLLKEEVWKSSSVCKAAGFLALLSSEVSAFIICLITLDRFFLLRFPFSTRLRLSSFSASLICVAAWTLGVVLATVPLFQSQWTFYGQNGVCLPLPITRRQFEGQQYTFAIFIVLNFILFVLIGVGQIFIYHTIRSSSQAAQKDSRKQEVAIARRLLLIVFTDFCCWFPIGLMGLLAARGVRIPYLVDVWAGVFVLPLNSALNPFLYTLNMLRQRRTDKEEEKRVAKMMNNLHVEMLAWPHDKLVDLIRHCLKSGWVQMGELLDEEGQEERSGHAACHGVLSKEVLPTTSTSQPETLGTTITTLK